MAIAKVQGPFAVNTASPSTASFSSPPTAGNLLIAHSRSHTGGLYSKASIPNWEQAVYVEFRDGQYDILFYKVAEAEESSDVVLTWTDSSSTLVAIEEWGGFGGIPALHKIASSSYEAALTSKTSGTTEATSIDAALCIACFAMSGVVTAGGLSNSFNFESPATGYDSYFASKVISAAAAQETTMSWTTAVTAGGLIAVFGVMPATNTVLKRYTGADWVKAKLNNKAAGGWENRPVKYWNGSIWVDVDGLGN